MDKTTPLGGEGQAAGWQQLALLQDLATAHGRVGAAKLLGVNYRTLVRALDSGQLTPTVLTALEALEGKESDAGEAQDPAEAPVATPDVAEGEQAEESQSQQVPPDLPDSVLLRLSKVEQRLDALERQNREGQESGKGEPEPATTPIDGLSESRPYPDVVTAEPEPGEEAVLGDAMSLVAEWRETRRLAASGTATKLDRIRAEERALVLELTLVEDHNLTLPPAEHTWDGIRRHSELQLRSRTLSGVRSRRRRALFAHSLVRIATLGIFPRGRS